MPVPASLEALSTTPASNPPAGSEPVAPLLDDHLRFGYSAMARLQAEKAAKGSNGDITALTALSSVPTVVTTAINARAAAGANNDITALNALASVPTVVTTAINTAASGKANTAGSASQQFSVANASTAAHAVALGQFLSTRTANGSFTLPDGLIVKFGRISVTVGTGGSVTFTQPFPGSVLTLVVGFDTLTGIGYVGRYLNLSASGFSYGWDAFTGTGSGSAAVINFVAIGF